jgi:hypothetical protein
MTDYTIHELIAEKNRRKVVAIRKLSSVQIEKMISEAIARGEGQGG